MTKYTIQKSNWNKYFSSYDGDYYGSQQKEQPPDFMIFEKLHNGLFKGPVVLLDKSIT